jgi:hypothetical protein
MNIVKNNFILFCVMFVCALFFNPMNILAYRLDDLYVSVTLIYASLYMASNMIWAHQIVHYLQMGHFNKQIFLFGIGMSLFFVYLMKNQVGIGYKQWIRRMIPHHSTALTSTNKLLENSQTASGGTVYRLAKDIVYNQEREIAFMKHML